MASNEMQKYATFTIQDSNQADFMMIPSYTPPAPIGGKTSQKEKVATALSNEKKQHLTAQANNGANEVAFQRAQQSPTAESKDNDASGAVVQQELQKSQKKDGGKASQKK